MLIVIIYLAANCAQAVVYWHEKIAIFNLPTLYAHCNNVYEVHVIPALSVG